MILLDTSGLLAAVDESERRHDEAARIVKAADEPFGLSPFVLAELDYLLATRHGIDVTLSLLADIAAGAYELLPFDRRDVSEAGKIIDTYRDLDVGLADASIVVLARKFRTEKILTLDERHFRVLRSPRGRPFTLLPADA